MHNRHFGLLFPTLILACGSDDTSITASSDHVLEASELGLQIAAEQGASLQLMGKTQAEVQQIGYGSYLANIGVCDVCHVSPAGEFYGGGTAFPVNLEGNVVYGMNLTPDAATGMALTQDQFIEVMRTGKDFHVPTGQAPQQLVVFPWYEYRWLSVADLAAMYAFFRALPPVANEVPASDKGAYFAAYTPVPFPDTYDQGDEPRALRAESGDVDGVLRGHDISPLPGRLTGAASGSDEHWLVGRGSYLVNTLGHCSDCHTNPSRDFNQNSSRYLRIETEFFLSGGFVFPVFAAEATGQIRSMSANLTGMQHGYLNQPGDSLERFLQTTGDGIKTDGVDAPRRLGWPMPWENFRRMTERDLTAVYRYLKTIPPRTGAADKLTQTVARYCSSDAACNAAAGETCNIATNECVGAACGSMLECGACQSCGAGRCLAPAANDPCFFGGCRPAASSASPRPAPISGVSRHDDHHACHPSLSFRASSASAPRRLARAGERRARGWDARVDQSPSANVAEGNVALLGLALTAMGLPIHGLMMRRQRAQASSRPQDASQVSKQPF